jgi:hypothetical protein
VFGAYGDAELVHAGDALYLPLWSMFLINFTECTFFYMLAKMHWDIFPSPPPHKLVLELPKIKSRQSTSRSSGLRSRKSLNLFVCLCLCWCVCVCVCVCVCLCIAKVDIG